MPAPREPAPREWTRSPAKPAAAGFLGGAAVVGMLWAGVTLRPSPLPEPPPPLVLTPAETSPSSTAEQDDAPRTRPSNPAPSAVLAASIAPTDPTDPSGPNAPPEPMISVVDRSSPAAADSPDLPISPTEPAIQPPLTDPSSGPSTGPTPPAEPAPVTTGARVAINSATAAQLELLPGIGPTLAQRILDDRAARGPFRSIADLKRVRGIGDKTAAKLEPLIRFD